MALRDRARLALRSSYHRIRLAPLAHAAATGVLFTSAETDLSHLATYPEVEAGGPLQRDEAILLYGAIRALRPRTVVEVGFLTGRSAFNFLRALDDDARLFSFDIDPLCARAADQLFGHDPRFRFAVKSQDQITVDDVEGRQIDLLFLDAAHDLELNQRTFEALEGLLAPRAVIAVHDTGTWPRNVIGLSPAAAGYAAEHPEGWVEADVYAHRPDERRFVNWITETRPGYGAVHFHTDATLRHGLTLLQGGGPLNVDPVAPAA